MKKNANWLAIFMIAIIFSHNLIAEFGKDSAMPPNTTISQSSHAFGLKLLQELIRTSEKENIVISPLSVSAALSMAMNGADGRTLQQMKKTLALDPWEIDEINRFYAGLLKTLPADDKSVTLSINNAIWYRNDLHVKADFKSELQEYYHAEIQSGDFKSQLVTQKINQWVSRNTNGKINSIIDRVNPMDIMYLLNAVYFYGEWTMPFDESMTHKDTFFVSQTEKIDCRMMRKKTKFNYLQTEQAQIIELPYGEKSFFDMFIILPKKGINCDDWILEADTTQIFQMISHLSRVEVNLQLPKFTVEFKTSLKEALSAMGMKDAFFPGANFSKMCKETVNISEVMHKTYIDVTEKGTEAAAVTGITMVLSAVRPMQEINMKVNRPFLFLITAERGKHVLFIGKIARPE